MIVYVYLSIGAQSSILEWYLLSRAIFTVMVMSYHFSKSSGFCHLLQQLNARWDLKKLLSTRMIINSLQALRSFLFTSFCRNPQIPQWNCRPSFARIPWTTSCSSFWASRSTMLFFVSKHHLISFCTGCFMMVQFLFEAGLPYLALRTAIRCSNAAVIDDMYKYKIVRFRAEVSSCTQNFVFWTFPGAFILFPLWNQKSEKSEMRCEQLLFVVITVEMLRGILPLSEWG